MSTAFARAGQILAGRYELIFPAHTQPKIDGVSSWIARDNARSLQVRAIVINPELPQATRVLDAARRTAFIYDGMTADPTAVSIISVISEESSPAVITEIPPGRPLSDYDLDRPLDPSLVRSIMGSVTSAVNAARRHGVRHLHLTPSDIYLTDAGQVVIDGFGIDAALTEIDLQRPSAELDRAEATGLTWLLAGLLVGKEASADAVAEAAELPDLPTELHDVVTMQLSGDGAQSPDELMLRLVPWGDIDLSLLPTASDARSDVAATDDDGDPVSRNDATVADEVAGDATSVADGAATDADGATLTTPVSSGTAAESETELDSDVVSSTSAARQLVDDLLGIEAVAPAPVVSWPAPNASDDVASGEAGDPGEVASGEAGDPGEVASGDAGASRETDATVVDDPTKELTAVIAPPASRPAGVHATFPPVGVPEETDEADQVDDSKTRQQTTVKEPADNPDETKVNATLITMTFFAVLVLLAAIFGFTALTREFDPVEIEAPDSNTAASVVFVVDEAL